MLGQISSERKTNEGDDKVVGATDTMMWMEGANGVPRYILQMVPDTAKRARRGFFLLDKQSLTLPSSNKSQALDVHQAFSSPFLGGKQ